MMKLFIVLTLVGVLALASTAPVFAQPQRVTGGGSTEHFAFGIEFEFEAELPDGSAAEGWMAIRTKDLPEGDFTLNAVITYSGTTPCDGAFFLFNGTAHINGMTAPVSGSGCAEDGGPAGQGDALFLKFFCATSGLPCDLGGPLVHGDIRVPGSRMAN